MRRIPTIASSALLFALVSCADEPEAPVAEPLGDEHMISTARKFDVLDFLSDDEVIEFGHLVCGEVDASGDFGDIEHAVMTGVDDTSVGAAMMVSAGAAVRSYCPEHTDALQDWADRVEAGR